MEKNFSIELIDKSNERLITFTVIVFVIFFLIIFISPNTFNNIFYGPFELEQENTTSQFGKYVSIEIDKIEEAPFIEIQEKIDKNTERVIDYKIINEFYFIPFGEKYLIIKANEPQKFYKGFIKRIPEKVTKILHEDSNSYLDFMVDTTRKLTHQYIILTILSIFLFVSIVSIKKYLVRIINPKLHPVNKILIKYGNLLEITENFNNDYKNEIYVDGKLKISKNWIVNDRYIAIDILRLNDIDHFTREHTTYKVNTTKTGDSHSVIFHSKLGGTLYYNNSNNCIIEDVIRTVMSRAPEINANYSLKATILKQNNKTPIENYDTSVLDISTNNDNKLFLSKDNFGIYGYCNENSKLIIPYKFENAHEFSEGLALVYITNDFIDKYGFINNSGKLVIDLLFDYAEDFSEDIALVRQDNKLGFIDKKGNFIIQPKYDDASSFKNGKAEVRIETKKFFINKNGAKCDVN